MLVATTFCMNIIPVRDFSLKCNVISAGIVHRALPGEVTCHVDGVARRVLRSIPKEDRVETLNFYIMAEDPFYPYW